MNQVIGKPIARAGTNQALLVFLLIVACSVFIMTSAGKVPVTFFLGLSASLVFVYLFVTDLRIFLVLFIGLRPTMEFLLEPTRIPIGGSSIQLVGFLGLVILFGGFFHLIINQTKIYEISVVGPMIIFLLVTLPVLLFFSLDKVVGFKDWIGTASSFMLFLLVASIFTNKKDILLLIKAMVLSSLVPLLVGFYQLFADTGRHIGGYHRIQATFTHPNSFAAFLSIMLLLCIPLMMESKQRWHKIAYGALCIAMLVSLINTYARASWFGFIGGLTIMAIFRYRKLLWAGPLLLLPLLIIAPGIVTRIHETTDYSQGEGSMVFRMEMWRYLLPFFYSSPIIGNGLGSFATFVEEGTGRFLLPHNDYIRILVDTGILGLISYLAIFVQVVRASLRSYFFLEDDQVKILALVLTAVMTGFLVSSVSENLFRTVVTQTYMWMLAGVVAGAVRIYIQKEPVVEVHQQLALADTPA